MTDILDRLVISEEAFEKWITAAENHTWSYDDLWHAACDWQKQKTKDSIKAHLLDCGDNDGCWFLTKESYEELFGEEVSQCS
jgi:urease accessory protein UreF